MIAKKDESDMEEALRKEEERMNRKLSSTAPVGGVVTGGLASPRGGISANPVPYHNPAHSQPVVHSQPSYAPVHTPSHTTGTYACSCGHNYFSGAKFCPECGKPQQASPVKSTGMSSAIDQTSMIGKKDDSEREEALKREEERMNKKLGNTSNYGANSGNYNAPVSQPVQSRPSYEDNLVEPVRNMNIGGSLKGPGVYCTYDVPGNPNSTEERPKMSVDQTTNYQFTPVPGKLGVNVEVLIEGSDVLKFKLTNTKNAVVVQKYSMPFPVGRENLSRRGDTIVLEAA